MKYIITRWKKTLQIAVFSIMFFTHNFANAYGRETHLDETMNMLLSAGIKPEVAERLAAYAQWVDVSFLNSALNPLFFVHGQVSRLLHFPTDGVDPFTLVGQAIIKSFSMDRSAAHGPMDDVWEVAKRNHEIANELFSESLKTGNLILMGAGLHVLMDSFAHEGFNYIKGHGDRGHYPDRPWMFVEKHEEMRKLLFKAITRIRLVLPPEAISNFKFPEASKESKDMTAEELAEVYNNNPLIKAATEAVPHNDPRYTKQAISQLIQEAVDRKWLKPEFQNYLQVHNDVFDPLFNGDKNGWEIVTDIVTYMFNLPEDQKNLMFNMDLVHTEMENFPAEIRLKGKNGIYIVNRKQILDSRGGVDQEMLKKRIVYKLCERFIPRPALGDFDSKAGPKDTFENDYLYRVEEIIQHERWQKVITQLHGIYPTDLDQSTSLSKIFSLFSKGQKDIADLDRAFSVYDKIILSKSETTRFMFRLSKYTILDFLIYKVTYPLKWAGKLFRNPDIKPLGNVRLTVADVPDALLWQEEELFNTLLNEGVYKQVLSQNDYLKLKDAYNKRQTLFKKKLGSTSVNNMSEIGFDLSENKNFNSDATTDSQIESTIGYDFISGFDNNQNSIPTNKVELKNLNSTTISCKNLF